MTFRFNLIDEPWIPCHRLNGEPDLLNLRDTLLQAHELRDLAGASPLQVAALYRLLLAILHRVFGPETVEEWSALWEAAMFDATALNYYLDEWHDRFDLFDSRKPFYQYDDERVKEKSIVSLKHGIGVLHNPLFDHDSEARGLKITPEEAARALLAVQCFGFGGLSGIEQKHTDAPGAKGILLIVQGNTLKATLLLNLIQYPDERSSLVDTSMDRPAWEMGDPFENERATPDGYLDYLTWQNRRIRLIPEVTEAGKIVVRLWSVGPGLRLSKNVRDSMKHYFSHPKNGYVVYRFDPDRQVWRNVDSFLAFQEGEEKTQPPVVLRELRHRVDQGALAVDCIFRCKALGMATDRRKSSKALFYREESFPLPLRYLQDQDLLNELRDALHLVEQGRRALTQALRLAGMNLYLPDADSFVWSRGPRATTDKKEVPTQRKADIEGWIAHTGAERRFWAALDVPFQYFVVELADLELREGTILNWRRGIRRAALDALDQALQGLPEVPGYRALVRSNATLLTQLNKYVPMPKKEG